MMKKPFPLTLFVLLLTQLASAQSVAENALGLRLGDDDGLDSFGFEITYQRRLERQTRRLEFDLAFRGGDGYDAFKLIGLYQWVEPLDGGFHWYYGAGAGIGNADFDSGRNNSFLLLAGNIGIEYDFQVPIQVFVDLRPEIGLGSNGYGEGLDFDLGLGARYQF